MRPSSSPSEALRALRRHAGPRRGPRRGRRRAPGCGRCWTVEAALARAGRGRRWCRAAAAAAIAAACAAVRRRPGRARRARPPARGNPVMPLVAAAARRGRPGRRRRTCTAARPARTSWTPRRCWSPAGRSARCWPTWPARPTLPPGWPGPPRHPDGRPYAAAAGGADDVRSHGGRLAGRPGRRPPPARRGARTRLAVQFGGAAGTLPGSATAGLDGRPRGSPPQLGLAEPVAALAHRPDPGRRPGRRARRGRRRRRQGGPGRDAARPDRGRRGQPRARPGGSSAMAHKRNPVAAVQRPRRARRRRPGWWPRCSPRWRRSTSGRRARGTPSGGRCASCSSRPARPRRGCATCLGGLRVHPEADAGEPRPAADSLGTGRRDVGDGSARWTVPWPPRPTGAGRHVNADVATAAALHYTVDGPADAPVLLLGPSLGTTTELWAPAAARADRPVPGDPLRPPRPRRARRCPPGPYRWPIWAATCSRCWTGSGRRAHVGRAVARRHGRRCGSPRTRPTGSTGWRCVCTSARLGPRRDVGRPGGRRARGRARARSRTRRRPVVPARLPRRRPDVVAGFRAMLSATPAEGYAACCGRSRPWT